MAECTSESSSTSGDVFRAQRGLWSVCLEAEAWQPFDRESRVPCSLWIGSLSALAEEWSLRAWYLAAPTALALGAECLDAGDSGRIWHCVSMRCGNGITGTGRSRLTVRIIAN